MVPREDTVHLHHRQVGPRHEGLENGRGRFGVVVGASRPPMSWTGAHTRPRSMRPARSAFGMLWVSVTMAHSLRHRCGWSARVFRDRHS